MMKKLITLTLVLGSILILSCQSLNNKKTPQQTQVKENSIDLLEVNFKTDLTEITNSVKFTSNESEFSEYLQALETKEVDNFSLANYKITSIKDIDVPNNNYIFCISVINHNPMILAITSLSKILSPKYLRFSL